jgi:hypothetical protein
MMSAQKVRDECPSFRKRPAVEGYRRFWACLEAPARRLSMKSWFPLDKAVPAAPGTKRCPRPTYLSVAFLDDQERLLREGEQMGDDILRGASPSQAVPWLDAMLGAKLRILPGNVLGEEQTLPWEVVTQPRLDMQNPWYRTYLAFGQALAARSAGRFPVSHGTLHGPTDVFATFRGHTQSLIDLLEEPEQSANALWRYARIFREITERFWMQTPRFCEVITTRSISSGRPASGCRSAIAVYSRNSTGASCSRWIAGWRRASIGLHAHCIPSMFLLDPILEIEELRCLQVNYEVNSGGPDVRGMLPFWRAIQKAGRSLLIRGSFMPDELRILVDGLDPRGLYLYLMVQDMREIERLRPIVGM